MVSFSLSPVDGWTARSFVLADVGFLQAMLLLLGSLPARVLAVSSMLFSRLRASLGRTRMVLPLGVRRGCAEWSIARVWILT